MENSLYRRLRNSKETFSNTGLVPWIAPFSTRQQYCQKANQTQTPCSARMQLKFLSNKGHTFRKWCQQTSVGAHVMRRRSRSSLGNARVIRIASTVEEKRSKKKLNCVGGNLKWSQQQQGIPPEKISILSQKRVVSSTPAFRISQGILTIWLALVTCKLSDILLLCFFSGWPCSIL